MTLIGPFNLDIQPGSTSSSLAGAVLVVSASLVEAAESITLFASTSIDGDVAKLQGTLDLGVATPFFRTLTVPGGDPTEQTGSQIAVGINQAVVIDPVPGVVGFRVLIDVPATVTIGFSLMGRTAPFTTGTIVVENTASVTIDAQPINVTGSVEVVASTGSVTIDEQPVLVTGSIALVGQPIDVTGSVEVVGVTEVTGSVEVVASTGSVTLDGQPIDVTGSVEVVGVTQVTGSVEVVAEPSAVTRSVTIDGQPIDVSGSVVVSDISQAEPVLVTGSVEVVAEPSAVTRSVTLDGQPIDVTGTVFTTPVGIPAVAATGSTQMLDVADADGESVTIDGKQYFFQDNVPPFNAVDSTVTTGGEDQSEGGGATGSAAIMAANLIAAINSGTNDLGQGAGVAYSVETTLHPTVTASAGSGSTVILTAKVPGVAGNTITLVTSNASNFTVSSGTFGSGLNDSRVTEIITGSVAVVDISQAEPVLVTGSFASVGVTEVTGTVEVVAEPLAETRSVTIDGQPITVTGSVGVTEQFSTVGVTGSLAITEAFTSLSVDLVFGDTVNVTNTQSIIIQGRAAPDTSPGVSPGGVPIRTFSDLGTTSSL